MSKTLQDWYLSECANDFTGKSKAHESQDNYIVMGDPWQRMEEDYNRRCAEMRKGMDFTEQVRAIEQVREAQFRKIMQLDAPKSKRWQLRRFMRRVFRRKQKYLTLNKRHDE